MRSHAYTRLTFNSPLSERRAEQLAAALAVPPGGRVLDLGAGWAELLIRVLERSPGATGDGVDLDEALLARGRAESARRGLEGLLALHAADATTWSGGGYDAAICIGTSHAWGGSGSAARALERHVRAGGRILMGEGFWAAPPTPEALGVIGELPDLAGLVDELTATGLRPLSISVASLDEWDEFESRWCAGLEELALAQPGSEEAAAARALAEEHRRAYLRGYRGLLGFAYVVLAAP